MWHLVLTSFLLTLRTFGGDMAEVTRHNDLGVVYMEQNNFAAAAREFEEVLKLHPNYVIGHINLGIAYVQMSRYDDAVRELKEALSLDPDNPYAHYTLGLIYKICLLYTSPSPRD